ncbi:MAG: hypothetical protein R3300_10620 [Candidatus Promineifilaceae bacterium]|nr:hypothetical protein [Candidatus Promineifilaceae bacterium]
MIVENRSRLRVALIATTLVILAVAVGWLLFRADPTLLRNAQFSHSVITPNADQDTDATRISYEITRNATVSIFFEDQAGQRYYFRQEEPRGVGEYEVLFSGVVDGYRLPGEEIAGQILARLLRDGQYTWHITATDEDGLTETASGPLTIAEADPELPEVRDFSLDRHLFTPNQDGIDDRVLIQFFLPKEVEQTRVFLRTPDGSELPIAEQERDVPPNSPGRHYYDYEGGVDNNATPPPDGTYPVIVIAADAEGQRVRVEDTLTIQFGGVPRAEIISPPTDDTVQFSATAVAVCDTITFTLTVENYGATPIRTTGPEPGTVYDSDWNYNTLGWHTESGAWRVAIGYENEITNYPYRWAVGNPEDLEQIGDHLYLMPGQRAVVSGSIRVVGPFGERNPQPVWAGLIHEDVEISQFNNRVDPHQILVDLPDADNLVACEPRAVPTRAAE